MKIAEISDIHSNIYALNEVLADIKNENVIPSGSPALVNPINIGIEEQEQNGVTVPSNAEIVAPVIPLNLVNIFLVFSGGK